MFYLILIKLKKRRDTMRIIARIGIPRKYLTKADIDAFVQFETYGILK